MVSEFKTVRRDGCVYCGESCNNGDKVVEVKYRVKSKIFTDKDANWGKAHLDCARNALYENYRMPMRKIRSIKTKRRIQPIKQIEPWSTPKPERGVQRGSNREITEND